MQVIYRQKFLTNDLLLDISKTKERSLIEQDPVNGPDEEQL
jgi:hypothetical protein